MSDAIPKTHPYWHVRRLVEENKEVSAVRASYYRYVPQTVADPRAEIVIPKVEFLDQECVASYMARAPDTHEMAVRSDILLNSGHRLHIPMVDMSTGSKAHLEKLRTFLGDNFFQGISWYTSGRSFHGYGSELLNDASWPSFMGLLLLANMPGMQPTVDPRWIGHRLVAGFSALRWTRNTPNYLGVPTNIATGARLAPSLEVGPIGKRLSSP